MEESARVAPWLALAIALFLAACASDEPQNGTAAAAPTAVAAEAEAETAPSADAIPPAVEPSQEDPGSDRPPRPERPRPPSDQETAPASSEPEPESQAAAVDDVYLPVDQAQFYAGTPEECWYDSTVGESARRDDSGFTVSVGPDDGSAAAPLRFAIIVHIEPLKAYEILTAYEQDRDRLTRFAELVTGHGGHLTIQTQRPFITTAAQLGDDIHRTWEAMGNEIAIHFHESEYVRGRPGAFGSDVPFEEWVAALGGLREEIQELVDTPVLNWSGGNLYERILEVAADAGLSVNTNFKDPSDQSTDPLMTTVSPWRPAGAGDTAERVVHDPNGPVVYLPSGIYPAHCPKAEATPRPYTTAAFDYITTALNNSLAVARPGYVNTFISTIHPSDFGSAADDEAEFARWNEWLTQVIDPLVADGRLIWSTASGMAQAFEEWEASR